MGGITPTGATDVPQVDLSTTQTLDNMGQTGISNITVTTDNVVQAVDALTLSGPGNISNVPSNLSPTTLLNQLPISAPSKPMAALMPGNLGGNMLVIGAQSQQHLTSIANVNAAGSIVPVMINFVVNINSKVNNLTNQNNLKLEDYYRYQFR
jgi:hypothetical protein